MMTSMFNGYFHEKMPWITRMALYIPLGWPGISIFTIRIGNTRYAATYLGSKCISKLRLED